MAADKILRIEVLVNGKKQVLEATKNIKNLGKAASGAAKQTVSDVDRANKSVAGFGKNATSSFAKQAQSLGGLVHVYATVAANVFALSAAYLVLKNNADLTLMAQSAEQLSITTGTNFNQIAEDMQKITNGALEFTEAMRSANLALSGGATTNQVRGITEIATKAANALGRSVPDAVNRMVQAVTKAEPELVDEFGIILRVGKAAEEYAKSVGKSVNQLTQFEKQQSIINQLLEQGAQKYGDVTAQVNPYEKLGASFSQLTKRIIGFVSGGLDPIAEFISNNSIIMVSLIVLLVKTIITKAIPALSTMGNGFLESAEKAKAASITMVRSLKDVGAAGKTVIDPEAVGEIFEDWSKDRGLKVGGKLGQAISNGLASEFLSKGTTRGQLIAKLKKALNLKKGGEVFGKSLNSAGFRVEVTQMIELLEKMGESTDTLASKVNIATADMRSNYNSYKVALLRGFGEITNASGGFIGTLRATSTAMKQVDVAARKMEGPLKSIGNFTTKAALASYGLVKSITSMTFAATGWIASATLVYTSLKSVLTYVGLLSSEYAKVSDSIDEFSKATKESLDLTDKVIVKYEDQAIGLDKLVIKYSALANRTEQVTSSTAEFIRSLSAADSGGFFNNIFSDNIADASEVIVKRIAEIEKLTGKPFKIELLTDVGLYNISDLTKGYYKLTAELVEKILKETDRLSEGQKKKVISNFADIVNKASAPINKLARAFKTAEEVSVTWDSSLYKLALSAKAVDVKFADAASGGVRELVAAIKTVEDSELAPEKKREAIKSIFEKVSEGIKQTFNFVGAESSAAVQAGLDKTTETIDTIKRAKNMAKAFTAEINLAKFQDRAQTEQSIQTLYDKQTKSLEQHIKAKKAELSFAESIKNVVGVTTADQEAYITRTKAELALLQAKKALYSDELANLAYKNRLLKAALKTTQASATYLSNMSKIQADIAKNTDITLNNRKDALSISLQLGKLTLDNSLRQLDTQISLLSNIEEQKRILGDAFNLEENRLKIASLLNQKDAARYNMLVNQREILQEQAKLAGSQTSGGSVALPLFDSNALDLLGQQFHNMAEDFAKTIGNAIERSANVVVSAFNAGVDTLIDGLISNWDSEEEGKSLGQAVKDAISDSLKQTLGDIIKDNIKQAFLKALSFQLPALQLNTAAIGTLTSAIQLNTSAQLSSSGSSGFSGNFLASVFANASSGSINPGSIPGGIPTDTYIHTDAFFATGGVVDKPTFATIGEGKNAEAVVPLPDNRSIPVVMQGGGKTISITQSFDFSGADAATEGRLRQYAEQIKVDTIRAISIDINRGGAMAKVVGRRR